MEYQGKHYGNRVVVDWNTGTRLSGSGTDQKDTIKRMTEQRRDEEK